MQNNKGLKPLVSTDIEKKIAASSAAMTETEDNY